MNTDDSTESSPFAAFAVPKRNPAEEEQERRRRAAISRRKMLGNVLACLVGATGGATACAAFDGDFDTVLTSLVAALIGSASGAALGAIAGAICFGVLSVANMRARTIRTDFVRRDPMSALRGLMFAWSLIGTAIGASAGAQLGLEQVGIALARHPLARWTMVGSLIGGAFGLAVWFFTVRSKKDVPEA